MVLCLECGRAYVGATCPTCQPSQASAPVDTHRRAPPPPSNFVPTAGPPHPSGFASKQPSLSTPAPAPNTIPTYYQPDVYKPSLPSKPASAPNIPTNTQTSVKQPLYNSSGTPPPVIRPTNPATTVQGTQKKKDRKPTFISVMHKIEKELNAIVGVEVPSLEEQERMNSERGEAERTNKPRQESPFTPTTQLNGVDEQSLFRFKKEFPGLAVSDKPLVELWCKVLSGTEVLEGALYVTPHNICFTGIYASQRLWVILSLNDIVDVKRAMQDANNSIQFYIIHRPDPRAGGIQIFTMDGLLHTFFDCKTISAEDFYQVVEQSWLKS